MRDPNASFNTHITEANSIVSTDEGFGSATVLLHFTSDSRGETLSVSLGELQITMNYKDIEALVKETRDDRKNLCKLSEPAGMPYHSCRCYRI